MDAKLMLVLTFTTIVVVAGYPSDLQTDFAAHVSQTILISCGECFFVTIPPQTRFCVNYCTTSKECKYRQANK